MSVPAPNLFRTLDTSSGAPADDANPFLTQSLAPVPLAVQVNVPTGGPIKTFDFAVALLALDADDNVVIAAIGSADITLHEVIPNSAPDGKGTARVLQAVGAPVTVSLNDPFTAMGAPAGTYILRMTNWTVPGSVTSVKVYAKLL